MTFKTLSIILNIILVINTVHSYEVNGFCGRPERPVNSRLIPDKDIYREGEEVNLQCKQYWNYWTTKRCVKGKWMGRQFRCGKTVVENDINYVKVEDMSAEGQTVLFDTNITLTPNYKFPNSFLSSRSDVIFQVKSDQKLRWTLGLQRPVSLPFFKINYHFINTSVEESLKIDLAINASVSPYRTCKLVDTTKKMWRFGTKVSNDFECDANSAEDNEEDMKSGSDFIIIETQTSHPIDYKLIALFLAESYGTPEQAVCGEPMMPFGQVSRSAWPDIRYSAECLDSMDYVSKSNPDLPDTTIHTQRCVYDMRWNGSYPECMPKTVCPTPEDQQNQNQLNPVYKVVAIDNVYYFNDTKWYAIDGTTIKYQCNNRETEVLLGDAIHVCKNGKWVGSQPNCFDLTQLTKMKQKNRALDEDNVDPN